MSDEADKVLKAVMVTIVNKLEERVEKLESLFGDATLTTSEAIVIIDNKLKELEQHIDGIRKHTTSLEQKIDDSIEAIQERWDKHFMAHLKIKKERDTLSAVMEILLNGLTGDCFMHHTYSRGDLIGMLEGEPYTTRFRKHCEKEKGEQEDYPPWGPEYVNTTTSEDERTIKGFHKDIIKEAEPKDDALFWKHEYLTAIEVEIPKLIAEFISDLKSPRSRLGLIDKWKLRETEV